MAIAIDSEIRSAMSPPSSGKATVRPESSEPGDDFAARLKRIREEAADDSASQPGDARISASPQSSLLSPDWSGASAPADPALAPQITATTAEPALTFPSTKGALEPSQFSLLATTPAETLASQAAAARADVDPIAVQSTAGNELEASELRTDRELAKADVKAAEAGTAIPSAGQSAILAGQTAPSDLSPAAAPALNAQVAEAEQPIDPANAPLPEGIAPNSVDAAAAVAAAGVMTVPTAQTSASGEKPASNLAISAPKASSKLAAIANADGNNPAPPSPVTGILPDIASAPVAGLSEAAGFDTGSSSAEASSVLTFATIAPGPSQPSATFATAASAPFASPNPVLVAVPAEIVNIVSKTAEDGQSDRVVVQLDPPELGRVSIDFKFDAQGVQHVIITSETPEAMRQLRQMHGELVQALERQGIGSQNMTFQHQQQSQQQSPQANPLLRMAAPGAVNAASGSSLLAAIQPQPSSPQLSAGGRLDIRL